MREKRCRSPRRPPGHESGRRSERCSARRPPTRKPWLPSVLGGLRGWPRRSRDALRPNSTQGATGPSAFRNYAGPQHFCHLRGVLRVGARNRAGLPGSGDRTFSSGAALAAPSFRNSVVLRDARHIKSQIAASRRRRDGGLRGARSATESRAYRRESGRPRHVAVSANSQEKRGFRPAGRLALSYDGVCIVGRTW